jgi:co-chaperonin GroES (HSP10)
MLDDRIAVIPVKDPPKVGLLWTPSQEDRRVEQGIIKYRGDNVKELKVGDWVLFSGYSGTRISYQDEGHFIVLRETDVLALLSGERSELVYTHSQVMHFFGQAVEHTLNKDKKYQTIEGLASSFEAELDAYANSLVEF